MSVPFTGTIGRSGGLTAAIAKHLKLVNLKPVKRIQFKFDPFHQQVKETRFFMFHFSTEDVTKTNLNCKVKSEVVCDRSDPLITFYLENGQEVVFKSANLNVLEMIQLFNKHISVLAPKEDTTTPVLATKSAKLSGAVQKKKGKK